MNTPQPTHRTHQMTQAGVSDLLECELRKKFGHEIELVITASRFLQSLVLQPTTTAPQKTGEKS